MIPKIIYTCWLSNDKLPLNIKYYIYSQLHWHNDYKHIMLDYNYFEKHKKILPGWVLDAFDRKIYSHVSDFLRVYALYNNGGIYLDSDVEIIKHENVFDKYLNYEFVSALENSLDYYIDGYNYSFDTPSYGISISPKIAKILNHTKLKYITQFKYGIAIDGAMMLAAPGCELLKNALDIYYSDEFSKYTHDNLFNHIKTYPNVCNILSKSAEKFGFDYSYELGKIYTYNDGKYILYTDRFLDRHKFTNNWCNLVNIINKNTELKHHVLGSWKKI